ncbi:hypothetical protein OQA88_13023 [Cercophora sp. LCS_1]
MVRSFAPWLLALPVATAQTKTVVTELVLPFIYPEGTTPVASILSAAPETVVYKLGCPSQIKPESCYISDGITFTSSASGAEWRVTVPSRKYGESVSCAFRTGDAICTRQMSDYKHTETFEGTQKNYQALVTPVIITAGLEKLSGGASATVPLTEATSLESAPVTEGATATSASTTESTSTETTPTAGVPRMTQNAVMAGVAAVMGAVLLL